MTTALIVPPWRQPLACYSMLTVPPTVEPITAAEAKLRAGLDWPVTDPREALMPKYIAAARNLVERETGLALLTQTREVFFCPYDPNAPFPLPPQSTPLQSFTVEAWEPGPFPTPVGPARPLVGLMPSSALTKDWTLPAGTLGAKLTVVAGWPDLASLEAEAPTLIQAVGLLVAHMLTLGKDLALTGAVAAISETPQGYEDCIAPHRLMWVT